MAKAKRTGVDPHPQWKESTLTVKNAIDTDPQNGSLNPPIYLSASYKWNSVHDHGGYEYSRTANPTRTVLQENLAQLEGGNHCSTHVTGMASITTVAHLFKQGDHVIIAEDCYGGTHRIFSQIFHHLGVDVSFIDLKNHCLLKETIQENTRCIWAESPSNPLLRLVDICQLSQIANQYDILLVVDNTFCSPILQKPLALGAHIVVHSLTKYVNGHSDVLGGAVITNNPKLGEKIDFLTNALGIGSTAFDSWLIVRGMKTLNIRYAQQQKSAQKVAEFLEEHTGVKRVIYPGLKCHPDHQLACDQQNGFGAVITFEVMGGAPNAVTVAEQTQLCTLAESLGGISTLIEIPAFHSHAAMGATHRMDAGISDGLLRLSIGLEDHHDIIEDLEQALVNIQLSAENIKGQEYTMPRSVTDMPTGGNAS